MEFTKLIQEIACHERGIEIDVELLENPRSGETLFEEFDVLTNENHEQLDWEPSESVRESIRRLLSKARK